MSRNSAHCQGVMYGAKALTHGVTHVAKQRLHHASACCTKTIGAVGRAVYSQGPRN